MSIRTLLTWNAEEYRSWEDFALGNAATETGIPRARVQATPDPLGLDCSYVHVGVSTGVYA